MKAVELSHHSGAARLSLLDADDLSDVLALRDAATAVSPIAVHNDQYGTAHFQNLLTRQTGVLIGIKAEGKLIAQLGILGSIEMREAIALSRISDGDIPFHHAALNESVVILQGPMVHPLWRSSDLQQNLFSFALQHPLTQIADHIFACLRVTDKYSRDILLRDGFGIAAAAFDAKTNQPTFLMQKPAFGFEFSPEIIVDDVDPTIDFAAIVSLTQREALVGIYEQGSHEKLAFMRNRELLNVMPTAARISL